MTPSRMVEIGPAETDLGRDTIVSAAVDIFRESGLDAVSMRSVSSRLGVSPIPLYRRVGNKDALVDAMADRLLAGMAPPWEGDEAWTDYARRWARALRRCLGKAPDSRLILPPRRAAYVEASRPLIRALRHGGFEADAAVQACRLLTWATVGFGVVESGAEMDGHRGRAPRPGGDPVGIDAGEADALFELHLRYLIEGIAADATAAAAGPARKGRRR